MKAAIAVCFLFAAVVLARPEEKKVEKYTDRYDNLDLDEILGNPKIMKGYMDCCLDKGRCTADAKELRSHIQEGLETNCEKCTDIQRKAVNKVFAHLYKKQPEDWAALTAKYDPNGKYAAKYEKQFKEITEQ